MSILNHVPYYAQPLFSPVRFGLFFSKFSCKTATTQELITICVHTELVNGIEKPPYAEKRNKKNKELGAVEPQTEDCALHKQTPNSLIARSLVLFAKPTRPGK